MPVNNKNPTVQEWESLRMFLQHIAERMEGFDNTVQEQGPYSYKRYVAAWGRLRFM